MPRPAPKHSRDKVRVLLEKMRERAGGADWKHPLLSKLADEVPGLQEIYYKRITTSDEAWEKIVACAARFDPPIDVGEACRNILAVGEPEDLLDGDIDLAETDRSFADSFDLDSTQIRRTIKDFRGSYLHFAQTLDGNAVVVAHCDLKDETYERKLPSYRFERRSGGMTYTYLGGYFRNDDKLFLVGSQQGSIDARLHVFNIDGRNDLFEGLMAGVSHRGETFSCRCALLRTDDRKVDLSRRYSFEEIRNIYADVYNFLERSIQTDRPLLVIEPHGVDM